MPEQTTENLVSGETAEPVSQALTCPLCHTLDHTVTSGSLRAGGHWECTRCGQTWDAARLATAAAYERYQAAHRQG